MAEDQVAGLSSTVRGGGTADGSSEFAEEPEPTSIDGPVTRCEHDEAGAGVPVEADPTAVLGVWESSF